MAIITSVAIPRTQVRSLDTGLYLQTQRPLLPAANAGDSIVVLTQPTAGRIYGAHLTVPATLGAGVTVKAQKRDAVTGVAVDITASSTAATAGVVAGTGLVPIDFNAGDTLEILVSGAAIAAGAGVVILDVATQHA
jgi:hypothetical protein